MKISWYGTASIVLENDKTKIVFDPFLRMNIRKEKIRVEDFIGADAIFATHGHFDHIMHIPAIMETDERVPVFCTRTPAETLASKGVRKERINVVAPGDTVTVGDIKITVKQGKHIKPDKAYNRIMYARNTFNWPVFLRLFYLYKTMPENNEIVVYEIECEGRKVTLLGSLGIDDNESYSANPDIMIFPYAGNLSIAAEGRPVLEKIKPKKLIFDHFDNSFPPMTFTMNAAGYAKLLKKTNPEIDCIIPEEKISIIF